MSPKISRLFNSICSDCDRSSAARLSSSRTWARTSDMTDESDSKNNACYKGFSALQQLPLNLRFLPALDFFVRDHSSLVHRDAESRVQSGERVATGCAGDTCKVRDMSDDSPFKGRHQESPRDSRS